MKMHPMGVCDKCARHRLQDFFRKSNAYYCPHRHVLSYEDTNGGWTMKIGVTPDRLTHFSLPAVFS
ncbi:MAG: hypothetical protein HQL76_03565 [Magnetococcales bacterium]|nr:hypothetical protein [Magnetococcales bacterium]